MWWPTRLVAAQMHSSFSCDVPHAAIMLTTRVFQRLRGDIASGTAGCVVHALLNGTASDVAAAAAVRRATLAEHTRLERAPYTGADPQENLLDSMISSCGRSGGTQPVGPPARVAEVWGRRQAAWAHTPAGFQHVSLPGSTTRWGHCNEA
jgi:hypothetical protein